MKRSTTVIRLKSVTKQFGDFTALENVSFAVKQGEIVGFVGANGAGKTTTISALLGFIWTSNGTAELFGKRVRPDTVSGQHSMIGYAAGDMELPPRLTGKQYLKFVGYQAKDDHTKRLAELEKRFKPQLEKKIGTLSRGNKQKIALIAAFMTKPELIVLDEPTSGLDPVMQEAFLTLVQEEQSRGTTIFMSSHYLSEVADVCTRVILMRNGTIVEDIATEDLLEKSGKLVRITTGYIPTRPPRGASEIKQDKTAKELKLSFVWKSSSASLQQWVASVKKLQDIEITEYNLEGAFRSLYEPEEHTV